MAAISQMIYLDAFSWMKPFSILIKISLNFVPNGLNRRQANIWINADPIYWRIYAALGGDELNVTG